MLPFLKPRVVVASRRRVNHKDTGGPLCTIVKGASFLFLLGIVLFACRHSQQSSWVLRSTYDRMGKVIAPIA